MSGVMWCHVSYLFKNGGQCSAKNNNDWLDLQATQLLGKLRYFRCNWRITMRYYRDVDRKRQDF